MSGICEFVTLSLQFSKLFAILFTKLSSYICIWIPYVMSYKYALFLSVLIRQNRSTARREGEDGSVCLSLSFSLVPVFLPSEVNRRPSSSNETETSPIPPSFRVLSEHGF